MNTPAPLVLLPVALAEAPAARFLPAFNIETLAAIRHFIVETPKAARAHLKHLGHPGPIAALHISAWPQKPTAAALDALLAPALQGHTLGLLSDAGCPAVADPGAELVARAHQLGIPVRPLIGPSSILLALMASGLGGQRFHFHGDLPIAPAERQRRIKALENDSRKQDCTQIFIETPYRNNALLTTLLATCAPATRLCLATDLTGSSENIRTQTIADWRKHPPTLPARQPMIFLLHG